MRQAPLSAVLKDGGRPLAALLALALGIKLLAVAAALDDDPLARHPMSDARYYLDRALGLRGVLEDPVADEPHHLPPLYPHVLALFGGIERGELAGPMVLQAVAGTLLLAALFVWTRRRGGRAAGWIAVALALAYWPLTFFETKLLGDSLACALLVVSLVAADATLARGRVAPALLLGVLAGAAALLRPQVLLYAAALVAWLAWRRRGRAALATALAAALTIAPATLHNLRASGDLVLVSDNGGVNLWLANTGPVSGTFATGDERFGDIARQARVAREVAREASGRTLSAGEVSAHFREAALDTILADPATFARRVLRRALALVEHFETGIVAIPEIERRTIAPLAILPLRFDWLLAAAAALAVLGVVPRRGGTRDAPRAPDAVPAWALAGMVVVTTLAFFHYSRFRLPLVPCLAATVGLGVERLATGWRGAGPRLGLARGVLALTAAAGVVGLAHLPAPHHDFTRANGWLSLGRARLSVARRGDLEAVRRALAEAERALALAPGFVRAELLAADAHMLLGEFDAAAAALDRIEAATPGYAPALVARAWLHATPARDNPHHDPARARRLAARVRLSAAASGDARVLASLQDLERYLEATAPPDGS